jgi:hypothetical protein
MPFRSLDAVTYWLEKQAALERCWQVKDRGMITGEWEIEGQMVSPFEACTILGAPEHVMRVFQDDDA